MEQILTTLYNSLTAHAMAMAPRLQGTGINLITSLAVISLSWQAGINLLKGGDVRDLLTKIVILGTKVGILVWLVNDLPSLGKDILDGFDWIGATLTGGSTGQNALYTGLAPVMKMMSNIWDSMGADKGGPSVWEWIKNTLAGGAAFWVKTATLLALIVAAAITAGMFLISQVLAGVALSLAPVFLPFLLLAPLSFMANGWIKFFVTTGVMKTVGVVMLSFGAALTQSLAMLSTQLAGQENAGALDLTAAVVTLLMAVVMVMLAWQIGAIANALTSGGLSASLDSGGIRSIASGGGGAGTSGKGIPKPPISGKPAP